MAKTPYHRRRSKVVKRKKSVKIKSKKMMSNRTKSYLIKKLKGTKKRVTISKLASEFPFPKNSLPGEIKKSMHIEKKTK